METALFRCSLPYSELIFHFLLSEFLFVQLIISALHSRGCGVGDALSLILPAHIVAPPPHLPDEILPAPHPFHDGLHRGDQLEFSAFSPDGGPVFSRLYTLLAPFLPVWL